MHRTWIAVVDASRARLFTLEREDRVEGVRDELVEREDLVDPARRLRTSELFSEARPGTGRSGELHFGFDDHRMEHVAKLDADFAREITATLATQLAAAPAQRLIVCASPHMLGLLRDTLDQLRRPDLAIDEVPRDLVKLAPTQLRDQLASYGLVQPREHG